MKYAILELESEVQKMKTIKTTYISKRNYDLYFYNPEFTFTTKINDVSVTDCIIETQNLMREHNFESADIVDSYTGEVLFSFETE